MGIMRSHRSPRAGLSGPIRPGGPAPGPTGLDGPAMALMRLDESRPSRAVPQHSPSVLSAQPRFPGGKMVCSVLGGAYPRHLRVRSGSGYQSSVTRWSRTSHPTTSRTVNQALDLPSDTATMVYASRRRRRCRHGGRSRKSYGHRGLCDAGSRHVTTLRWTVLVGCVALAGCVGL
jgi:hypothetical protein